MLDIAISAALAVFALAMGFLGLWMSLHVPDTASKKRSYKIAFGVLSLLSVALVVWQGIRNAQAQSSLQSDVRDARNEASEARKEAKHVREQFGKVQNELEREGVRRQQAERDLALIVQSAGKETRAGVADDIRKTPLKIDVSEFKRPPRITSVNRWPAEPNSSPPYEVKFLVMVDQTVTPIRLMVECANVITSAEGMILGSGARMGGGWGGRFSERQWGIGILSPAWTSKDPLIVSVKSQQKDLGTCNFTLR
jgi:type II secretory pathway pseudopilin PulG